MKRSRPCKPFGAQREATAALLGPLVYYTVDNLGTLRYDKNIVGIGVKRKTERRDIRSPTVCQPGSIYAQDNAPTHIYPGQEVPRAPHTAGWLTREWTGVLS